MITSVFYGFHRIPNWKWSIAANAQNGYTLWSVWGGKGVLQVGQTAYPLKKGDVFLLDYSEAVFGTEDNEDILEVRFLDFDVDEKNQFTRKNVYRHFENPLFLLELFKRIAQAQDVQEIATMRIWSEAILQEYQVQQITAPISFYTNQIDAICTTFEQHPEQTHDIRSIAETLGLNTDYFIRVFTREKGMTPYAYLSKIRIEYAKGLLLKSNLSISQIAASLGFSDLCGFSHFFKTRTGLSPSDYKKAITIQ